MVSKLHFCHRKTNGPGLKPYEKKLFSARVSQKTFQNRRRQSSSSGGRREFQGAREGSGGSPGEVKIASWSAPGYLRVPGLPGLPALEGLIRPLRAL